MSNSFSGLEMLKIAILMEDEGYNFYKNGIENTSGEVKKFLLNAAEQESMHKENFSKLYDEMSAGKEEESEYLFDNEVAKFLGGLIENQVFDKKAKQKDAFKDLKSAVKNSLNTEELTVKIYTELYKGIKHEEAKEIMTKIIEEEKQHVEYFKNLLEKLPA